jgi:16S rRNA C1402 (ribose-2'-O) methylase RsmI
MKTLESLAATFASDPNTRTITVARELTKLHEEVVAGSPDEVLAYFTREVIHQKGEFVVLVSRG